MVAFGTARERKTRRSAASMGQGVAVGGGQGDVKQGGDGGSYVEDGDFVEARGLRDAGAPGEEDRAHVGIGVEIAVGAGVGGGDELGGGFIGEGITGLGGEEKIGRLIGVVGRGKSELGKLFGGVDVVDTFGVRVELAEYGEELGFAGGVEDEKQGDAAVGDDPSIGFGGATGSVN